MVTSIVLIAICNDEYRSNAEKRNNIYETSLKHKSAIHQQLQGLKKIS
jgi:hypothetical protein